MKVVAIASPHTAEELSAHTSPDLIVKDFTEL